MSAIVLWFRRDLRLEDNTALHAAARDSDIVVPVFILDDHYLHAGVGPSRFVFLRESLDDLARSLAGAGSRLIVRTGPASDALPRLLAETGASAVYVNEEIGPYPSRRDQAARKAVESMGAAFRVFSDSVAADPRAILSLDGRPYSAFTPFARRWREAEKPGPVPSPPRLATPALPGVEFGRVRAWRGLEANPAAPRGGESAARAALARFLSGPIRRYAHERDFPAAGGTSKLSASLHFGTISPRTILAAAKEAWRGGSDEERGEVDTFVTEICWREFFHSVLFHFPRVAGEAFRPELDAVEWDEPGEKFERWKEGRTGYPFIDAAMRQLTRENFMHNRARMAVASFLTKDLHISWREGERWFEHELADADLANNNGGWQWAAGTGADAAPYFRIFNPVLQSKKFDPSGAYIRRHVPELARLPDSAIHEPADPIVDHAAERAEALRRYARAAATRR